jgi:hypothetical protein
VERVPSEDEGTPSFKEAIKPAVMVTRSASKAQRAKHSASCTPTPKVSHALAIPQKDMVCVHFCIDIRLKSRF